MAARDSSRTSATINDVFTALCEDASVYQYFRGMKGATIGFEELFWHSCFRCIVYGQIEHLSKSTRGGSRRSKSFTRSDKGSVSRTSTSQQESSAHTLTGSLSRQSSQSSAAGPAPGHITTASRSSFDKSRAMRMFANGKSSHEREESISGHKKSASLVSESAKRGSLEGDFVEVCSSLPHPPLALTSNRMPRCSQSSTI